MVTEAWSRLVWGLLDYKPNAHQWGPIRALILGVRAVLICGGERAGKSFTSVAAAMLMMGPKTDDNGEPVKQRYWIVGPDYRQARAEFLYMFEAFDRGGFITKKSMPEDRTSSWLMRLEWGVEIETRTSNDITKLASFPLDGVLIVEAAQQIVDVFWKMSGRVAEKRGWIILSGTLENSLPWYAEYLNQWKTDNKEGGMSFSLPTWSNTAIFPGGREDPEIKHLESIWPEDLFMERFGAESRRKHGLVLPEFDFKQHVKALDIDPKAPIELWIDPGKNAYAVLAVQIFGQVVHVVDAYYGRDVIVHDVIPDVMKRPWWNQVEPGHGGVIDIAGTHQYGLPSHVEVWQSLAGIALKSNYVHQEVSRKALRFRLKPSHLNKDTNGNPQPLIFFNARTMTAKKGPDGTAYDVLAEPGLWTWPQGAIRSTRRNEPRQPVDANNHAMKALSYGLYHHYGPAEERDRDVRKIRRKYYEMA